jgi:uracil-DNA glycosylase
MNVDIEPSWKSLLKLELNKSYFLKLINFVKEQYEAEVCYPKPTEIFNAFNHCKFEDLKIVIIGQDPYHGTNQANGLCFSVNDGITHPPSLINIFKELQTDINMPYPKSGNLMPWANQGVLLLNATLTVVAHEAGSHQKQGWETFTDALIKLISDQKEDVIFLLWGGFAKKKTKLIDTKKHHVLTSGHPSPLSANRGYWFGNNHFSKANDILNKLDEAHINWTIV